MKIYAFLTILLLVAFLGIQEELPAQNRVEIYITLEQGETLLAQAATDVLDDAVEATTPSDAEQATLENTPIAYEQAPASEEETTTTWQKLLAWLKDNWVAALFGLLAIVEVVVTLTPTERDNSWFVWLKNFVQSILPNRKAGGGTHIA